jgi:hypothetical protein
VTEAAYQRKLIRRIKERFPGCLVLKNNPQHIQGIPDLLVLYRQCWGALEVKVDRDADVQANQPHYVSLMDEMSFAAFIYPDNEEEVLHALQTSFESGG